MRALLFGVKDGPTCLGRHIKMHINPSQTNEEKGDVRDSQKVDAGKRNEGARDICLGKNRGRRRATL
jgi:hypothetical protein